MTALAIERGDVAAAQGYRERLTNCGWEVSYNLALLQQNLGQLDEAADLYRETLETKPDCGEALLNLGHVLNSQGRDGDARECWKAAVAANPEIASRYFASPR